MVALDYTMSADYEEGEKYILFLYRRDYVYKPIIYYEAENVFHYIEEGSSEDEYIYKYYKDSDCVTGNIAPECTMTFENLKGGYELSGLIRYAAEYYGYDGYLQTLYPEIMRGEELETVIKNSDYLLKIRVDSVSERVQHNKYDCTVLEIYKKQYLVADEISVTAMKDSLEPNKEYIIALYTDSIYVSSVDFTLSADNGIIPLEDEVLVEEFNKYYIK